MCPGEWNVLTAAFWEAQSLLESAHLAGPWGRCRLISPNSLQGQDHPGTLTDLLWNQDTTALGVAIMRTRRTCPLSPSALKLDRERCGADTKDARKSRRRVPVQAWPVDEAHAALCSRLHRAGGRAHTHTHTCARAAAPGRAGQAGAPGRTHHERRASQARGRPPHARRRLPPPAAARLTGRRRSRPRRGAQAAQSRADGRRSRSGLGAPAGRPGGGVAAGPAVAAGGASAGTLPHEAGRAAEGRAWGRAPPCEATGEQRCVTEELHGNVSAATSRWW